MRTSSAFSSSHFPYSTSNHLKPFWLVILGTLSPHFKLYICISTSGIFKSRYYLSLDIYFCYENEDLAPFHSVHTLPHTSTFSFAPILTPWPCDNLAISLGLSEYCHFVLNSFIEIHFINHRIFPFKMYSLMIFRIYTEMHLSP